MVLNLPYICMIFLAIRTRASWIQRRGIIDDEPKQAETFDDANTATFPTCPIAARY